jgi:TatD DNase family protein
MDIIDSHAHLFMSDFADDYPSVLQRARESGVTRIVNVGLEKETNNQVLAAARETAGLHPTIGWHPHEALKLTESDLPELFELALKPEVVAFGEIGLDYHWGKDYIPAQKTALNLLLEVASQLKKPIIVHCRDAWSDFLSLIQPYRAKLTDILLHCYSGDLTDTKKALDLDCHFSYSGVITFPKAEDLRKTIPIINPSRILIETDCPYLAPIPKRGKRNEPSLLVYHLEALAKALDLKPAEAADLTANNASRLFKLTGPAL